MQIISNIKLKAYKLSSNLTISLNELLAISDAMITDYTSAVFDYLMCDKILACGGSWMVKGELINAGNFAEIELPVVNGVYTVQVIGDKLTGNEKVIIK